MLYASFMPYCRVVMSFRAMVLIILRFTVKDKQIFSDILPNSKAIMHCFGRAVVPS